MFGRKDPYFSPSEEAERAAAAPVINREALIAAVVRNDPRHLIGILTDTRRVEMIRKAERLAADGRALLDKLKGAQA